MIINFYSNMGKHFFIEMGKKKYNKILAVKIEVIN